MEIKELVQDIVSGNPMVDKKRAGADLSRIIPSERAKVIAKIDKLKKEKTQIE